MDNNAHKSPLHAASKEKALEKKQFKEVMIWKKDFTPFL